jgi:hypothetical protein
MRIKVGIVLVLICFAALFAASYLYIQYLHKAHSTFENYYKFRGCVQLLQRTDTYGICKVNSGETIKIVKYQNKWYLDGDLPVCTFNICF